MDSVMTTDLEIEPVRNGHDETLDVMPDDGESTVDATNGVAAKGEQLVPVSEAKKYRKRAQAAEKQVGDLQEELKNNRQALVDREQELEDLKRSQAMDAALHEHGAIEMETARLVLRQTLDGDEEKDVSEAVSELRRRKPFLFRPAKRVNAATTLGPRPVENYSDARLERAAAEAVTTGKRSDVLRYLRLRRK